MPAPPPSTAPSLTPARHKHTVIEDIFGLVAGVVVTSFALFLLRSTGAVTGGIAGLALAVEYWSGVSVSLLVVVLNVPFLRWRCGRRACGLRCARCLLWVG